MAMGPVPAPGGDPSMDDILASIRKILNEDDVQQAAAPVQEPPPAAVEAEEEEEDIMDLTSDMMIEPSVTAEEMTAPEPPPPPVAAPPISAPPEAEKPRPAPSPVPQPTLVSLPAAAAAAASLGQLSRAVAQDRAASVSRTMGLSIEDVVREEVRPLLREWLDVNLPPLVERLVRAEIERVMARAG